MHVEFIGVGEAFQPQLGNTSYLLHSETKLLIDCGYGTLANFFGMQYPSEWIDAIYITHFHADHYFGLPPLLNCWREERRTKSLTIIGQPGIQERLTSLFELAYAGMQAKLEFDIQFIECEESLSFNELNLHFADTAHSVRNLAIKVESRGHRIGISGDGRLTEASKRLFENCHLLIHEATYLKEKNPRHASLADVLAFACTISDLNMLALVHIHRKERHKLQQVCQEIEKGRAFSILIPGPGDIYFPRSFL